MRKVLKRTLYTSIVLAFVIVATYIAGTFNPNYYTTTKIEDEVHRKEMKVVEELGLKEPEFDFTDKVSFINATAKCIAYLNWTTDRDKRVPTSIIIAMAGIESAWGRSRFASEGNALFGQWVYNDEYGIKAAGSSVTVRRFPDLLSSVRSYMRNLNSHRAYRQFRTQRFDMLKQNKPLLASPLLNTLKAYAEDGNGYVRTLRSVLRTNRFDGFVQARLAQIPAE